MFFSLCITVINLSISEVKRFYTYVMICISFYVNCLFKVIFNFSIGLLTSLNLDICAQNAHMHNACLYVALILELHYQYRSVAKSCLTVPPHALLHARLSFTVSWSLLKLKFTNLVMPSYPSHASTISSSFAPPFSSCLQSFSASRSFPMTWFSHQVAKVFQLQLQHVLPVNIQGFLGGSYRRESDPNAGDPCFASWVGKIL